MTKYEQTIANLKKLKSVHNGSYGVDIDRAIKAMEQEPCEDAISRQTAIDAIWDGINMDIYTGEVKECLEALPSVTPKQKTGKWIEHDTGHSIYYDCSLCGCAAPCTETADKILWKLSNYCPDCGAKMENGDI
jgi:hypothetical protein